MVAALGYRLVAACALEGLESMFRLGARRS
jgi:hypothetical protein